MKKLLLAVVPLAALAVACSSGESSDSNDKEASPVNIDTFYSADRAFADVRGNAKLCVIVTNDMELSGDTLRQSEEALTTTLTQTFNADGFITSVKQADTFMDQPVGSSIFEFEFDKSGQLISSSTDFNGRFEVKRNGEGYVTTFTSIGANGTVDYTKVYTWDGPRLMTQKLANEQKTDDEGNYIPMPIDKVTYNYDKNGYLISEVEESGDPQLEMNITETNYKYNSHDDHGNWTLRDVNRVAKVYKVNGGKRVLTDSVSTYQNESRNIQYFQK